MRRGDNLSLIAWRFGTTVAKLQAVNQLPNDLLSIGQVLLLQHPFGQRSARRAAWHPVVKQNLPVLLPYGPYKAGDILMRRTGVTLEAVAGTSLYCPSPGVVRFSGIVDGLGHVLIIEHADGYSTVVAPCDPARIMVAVGQAVVGGTLLASTAAPELTNKTARVHLELRHDDKTISPRRLHP